MLAYNKITRYFVLNHSIRSHKLLVKNKNYYKVYQNESSWLGSQRYTWRGEEVGALGRKRRRQQRDDRRAVGEKGMKL
jgi:hypothetical protein